MKRTILPLLLVCAELLQACEGCEHPSPTEQRAPVEIRTERPALERFINLPPGTRAVRWVVLPRGSEGLGPTDYVLHAYIELDDEGLKTFEQQGGQSSETATLWIPEEVARGLLPPRLHPSAVPENGSWSISGHELDARSLTRMPYQIDEAIRMNSGLLVIASTR